jgi:serine/threonine protein phosphatase PrpC
VRGKSGLGMAWSVGGASARGSAHIRKGLRNQDAILWSPASGSGDAVILAVSDGHGSKEHYRSDTGSRLAVEAAVATLGDFLSRLRNADLSAINAAAIEIPSRLHSAWCAKVDADLEKSPIEPSTSARRADRFLPYGATLVAAAAAPRFVLLVQIGDGDLVVGFSDGRLTRPLPDDTGLVGEQTHSLCDPDAAKSNLFRLQVLPVLDTGAKLDFLMLSTDGLSKSCPDDGAFMKLAAEWRGTVSRDGVDSVSSSLESWLASASERGSGDDITLGFAVRRSPADRLLAAKPEAGKPASLERRMWLATLLSYASIGISVFTLLALTRLWWSMPAPQPPQATRPSLNQVPPADSAPVAPTQPSTPADAPDSVKKPQN